MKTINFIKNELVILKVNNRIIEKQFSHYKSKNSNYFFTTDGQIYCISQIA